MMSQYMFTYKYVKEKHTNKIKEINIINITADVITKDK